MSEMPTNLPPAEPPTSTLAIVSLASGILGWTLLPLIGAIVAVVTGHMAKREIAESAGTLGGEGLATAGLVLGYAALAVTVLAVCALVCLVLFMVVIGSQQDYGLLLQLVL